MPSSANSESLLRLLFLTSTVRSYRSSHCASHDDINADLALGSFTSNGSSSEPPFNYSTTTDPNNKCWHPTWSCAAKDVWQVDKSVQLEGKPPGFLGGGAYGEVWAVLAGAKTGALKILLAGSSRACNDIRKEADKLSMITQAMSTQTDACMNTFVHALDLEPCNTDSQGLGGAYVMEAMEGTLQNYQKNFESCEKGIAAKAARALDCLHKAGWVHADVKPANFLWRGTDETGCPQEVRLADFGLSGEIKGRRLKFLQENYTKAWNLPSDMFAIDDAARKAKPSIYSLKLSRDKLFEYQPGIDWCSFHLFFGHVWNSSNTDEKWTGECGPMGANRTDLSVKSNS